MALVNIEQICVGYVSIFSVSVFSKFMGFYTLFVFKDFPTEFTHKCSYVMQYFQMIFHSFNIIHNLVTMPAFNSVNIHLSHIISESSAHVGHKIFHFCYILDFQSELKCPITFGNSKMVKFKKNFHLALGCTFHHEL